MVSMPAACAPWPGSWRWRFAAALAALIASFGILLAGRHRTPARPPAGPRYAHDSTGSAVVLLVIGLLFPGSASPAGASPAAARRRNDLSLSPGLMKKRD